MFSLLFYFGRNQFAIQAAELMLRRKLLTVVPGRASTSSLTTGPKLTGPGLGGAMEGTEERLAVVMKKLTEGGYVRTVQMNHLPEMATIAAAKIAHAARRAMPKSLIPVLSNRLLARGKSKATEQLTGSARPL